MTLHAVNGCTPIAQKIAAYDGTCALCLEPIVANVDDIVCLEDDEGEDITR